MDSISIKKEILTVLTYFSLFDYPLKKGEVFIFLKNCRDLNDYEYCLESLVEEQAVFQIAEFYSLEQDYALAVSRMAGNAEW